MGKVQHCLTLEIRETADLDAFEREVPDPENWTVIEYGSPEDKELEVTTNAQRAAIRA